MSPATGAIILRLLLALPAASVGAEDDGLLGCEALLRQAPDAEAGPKCLFELAVSQEPGSRSAAQRLSDLQRRQPENPWPSLYLGRWRWNQRSPDVERIFRQAAEAAARRHEARVEVPAREGLVRLLRGQGRVAEAGRERALARAAAQRSGDPALLARAAMLDAQESLDAGRDLERAWQSLVRLDDRALTEPAAWRECQRLRAHLAYQTGRYDEGRKVLRELAEQAAAEGNSGWAAAALLLKANFFLDEQRELPTAGGREELLSQAREAAAAAALAQRPETEAGALWLAGSAAGGEAGRPSLERCLELTRTDSLRSSCASALALALAESDPARATAELDEAMARAARSGQVLPRISAWLARMHVSWAISPRERALADSRAALDEIEALRDRQAGTASQPGLFSTWTEDYYWLSGHLLEGEHPEALEQGFAVLERMRSRTLMDALGLARSGADTDFVSLAELRRELASDEALLSFQVAPWRDWTGDFGGGTWLVASTQEGTRRYRLTGDRTWLRPAASTFAGLVAKRDGAEAGAAGVLYQKLLAGALADLPPGVERLTLIPDDALHRLPFAALSNEGQPLAARYRLTLVPSATLWLRLRRAPERPAAVRALALADPALVMESSQPGESRPLPELPFARREARSVVRLLGGGSVLGLDEEASEALVKAAPAGRYGLLHFATHAVVDAVEPERSYVLLAPGGPAEDGRLTVREIVDLDLAGRVVVLSSCSTAAGAVLRGEGVMSLARAFFQAGATTVVATLWPLRDDDGAALFERFYAHLARGETVAGALQAAQRDRIADGAPAEAWAGAVVLGHGDVVPLPGGRPWWVRHGRGLLLGLAGLLALLGLVATARSASRGPATARPG